MDQVGEWCRENLSGAAIEVHSSGTEGVTVSLPYELTSLSSILAELSARFDVDVDYVTADHGGALKIYRDFGVAPLVAPPVAEPPARRWWPVNLFTHLAWAAVCAAVLYAAMSPATARTNGTATD
jgi:hypothetical protein